MCVCMGGGGVCVGGGGVCVCVCVWEVGVVFVNNMRKNFTAHLGTQNYIN